MRIPQDSRDHAWLYMPPLSLHDMYVVSIEVQEDLISLDRQRMVEETSYRSDEGLLRKEWE